MKKFYFILFFVLSIIYAKAQDLITEVEAETGILSGTVIAGPEGASSGQFVTGFDADGDKVTVTVNVPASGSYDLVVQYRSIYGDKTNDLYVNGAYSSGVIFFTSSDFVEPTPVSVVLNAGDNTLEIVKNWGYVDIDKFSVYTKPQNSYNITSTLSDNQVESSTQKLYDFIRSQYGSKIITGQTSDYYDEVVSITGKNPLVRGFDLLSYSPMYPYNWDGSGHTFGAVDNGETEKVINWYNATGKKGVVEVHWHWYSPSGGQPGTNTFFTSETTFDVSQAVIPGTQENIDALRDIDTIAVQLKRIRDVGVPVIWRPLHEAGGGWFWWGAKGPDACLALWDMVRDRLTNYHGLHNLIWCWSTHESDWYPGHAKVDILGFDSYPGAYNYTIQKTMFDTYHDLGEGTKIVAMTENGAIPELGDAIDLDARWSWFCAWNDMVVSRNTTQHIVDMYNHPYALTVENCPSYQNESVATPDFNPPSGTYSDPQSVVISTSTTGAAIYYTTDGSIPTTSSSVYSSPINVTSTTTIRAMAAKSGLDDSGVASATYTFNVPEFQIGGIYKLTARHSNKVMEVAGSSFDNGAVIQQNSDADTDNQKWEFADGGAGTYKLIAVHSGKALDISGSSTTEGAPVVQWDLLSNPSQQWNIVSVGDGYYKVENLNSGKVLGFSSKRKNSGIPVKQYDYSGAIYQQWKIELIGLKSAKILTTGKDFQDELKLNSDFILYPNPTKGDVNIDLTHFDNSVVDIVLLDLNGIKCSHIQTTGGGIYTSDVSRLQKGCYFVRIVYQGIPLYKKLLVE